ncbi:MAG: DUF6580 family putative transport protein [Elusimicrobiota bacterium]
MFQFRFLTIVGMIGLAALSRLIPHPWNFTPVGAMALFAGAQFEQKKHAFLVPLLAVFISDLFLGFYPGIGFVYLSYVSIVFVGFWLKESLIFSRWVFSSMATSVLFFIISNFGVWMSGGLYPLTLSGLAQCFVAAIPFFRNTMVGDFVFSSILFGSFLLASLRFPSLKNRVSC